jgi:hypothetical protein
VRILAVGICLTVSLVLLLTSIAQAARPSDKSSADLNAAGQAGSPAEVDRLLAAENSGKELTVAPTVGDLGFLRRVTVDLIGRIPTAEEIREFEALPASTRRAATIDRLLLDPRFADRWTVFYSDMLRIRSYTDGGAQLAAFVHKAVDEGMPYDLMCKQLIAANGKAGRTPEVGFILGDAADPMAMAGVTSQVFMGIRIACAQCHDHPFDVWTREQFYGLAAYFGKTQRRESELTRSVYTVEIDQTTILWPPEDKSEGQERKPMSPAFPFEMDSPDNVAAHVVRLARLREAQARASEVGSDEPTIDDLLADAGGRAVAATEEPPETTFDVAGEAKQEARNLKVEQDLYQASQLRKELAEYVTSPRNRYFAQAFVNRVWAELIGRGIVEPIDDFSIENTPSHPQTLAYLSDEFVASGFDLRSLLRLVANTETYQRDRLLDVDEGTRQAAEEAFVSAPLRRMLSESLFDSVVQAGHLFDVKYPAGVNMKTIRNLVRVPVEDATEDLVQIGKANKEIESAKMEAMRKSMIAQATGYDLESAIEVDFNQVLAMSQEEPAVDEMQIVSNEELEAMEMTAEAMVRRRYIEKWIEAQVDDNPVFASAMRMASPADPSHFLRVFGQPSRETLGEHRDDSASMRQALMMLNGRLTNEAARVGDFEPIFELIVGKKADVNEAVRFAYREILTREPSADELAEGKAIVAEGETPRDGLADLRWVLFNCHEFRYLP